VTGAGRAMPWTGPMFLAAALALSGLRYRGVSQRVPDRRRRLGPVAVRRGRAAAGVRQSRVLRDRLAYRTDGPRHGGRAGRGRAIPPVGERSAWMVAGMLGCLFVVIALGVHLPGDLGALLSNASHRLAVPA